MPSEKKVRSKEMKIPVNITPKQFVQFNSLIHRTIEQSFTNEQFRVISVDYCVPRKYLILQYQEASAGTAQQRIAKGKKIADKLNEYIG